MPVQAFFDDRYLVEKKLVNYWGYNTINYFSLAPRYISPGGDVHEFKVLVRRLHEAGIEVILDVVYNHTAEGNHLGPDAVLPRHRQCQLLHARPTTGASISTRPAAATRSTCAIRACCRW